MPVSLMQTYAIFGHVLRSEIDFPELRTLAGADPRWTLRRSRRQPPLNGARLLGEEDTGDGTHVRLYARTSPHGYRLEYDDSTGAFDVSADGREMTWFPAANPNDEMVRLHIIGRVFATALHASGMYCLHGSGVALGDGAVGFAAPRFWGKSTLALALTQSGARLVSDDTLPIHPDGHPLMLWPGVHSVRLWGDSAARIAGQESPRDANPFAAKRTLSAFPDQRLASRPEPLSAIYLLAPHEGNGHSPAVRRTPVPPVAAALALIGHAKIGALLGKFEARRIFDRAVRVASGTPVYRLDLPRDFEHIDEVAAQLFEWHDGCAAPEGSRS